MRRLAFLIVVAACASIQSPPGGPLRTTPPVLLSVTPDSEAVNVTAKTVVFTFDEVVSDRPSGSALLENVFLVSPRQGDVDVNWKRSRIEVRPHNGFQPNTAYAVTMLPGIEDLRSNVLRTGHTAVFSTGAEIPAFSIRGRVFDWMRQEVAPHAFVEAIRNDSIARGGGGRDTIAYLAIADSTGQFEVAPIPRGNYTVRATIDANSNRALDRGEAWDTITTVVRDTVPFLELLAAIRDTVGPSILTSTPSDSVTIALYFDRAVDSASAFTVDRYRLVSADSTPLRVARVLSNAAAAAIRAATDSANRADSAHRGRGGVGAGGDTTPARRAPATVRDTASRRSRAAALLDTATKRAIRPTRPAPPQDVVIVLDPATPMQVNAHYRITARDVRNLAGIARTSDREFTMPAKPTAPATAPSATPPARTPPGQARPQPTPPRPPSR